MYPKFKDSFLEELYILQCITFAYCISAKMISGRIFSLSPSWSSLPKYQLHRQLSSVAKPAIQSSPEPLGNPLFSYHPFYIYFHLGLNFMSFKMRCVLFFCSMCRSEVLFLRPLQDHNN